MDREYRGGSERWGVGEVVSGVVSGWWWPGGGGGGGWHCTVQDALSQSHGSPECSICAAI